MAKNHREDAIHPNRWESLADELGLPPQLKRTLAPAVAEVPREPKNAPTDPVEDVAEESRRSEEAEAEFYPMTVRPVSPPVAAPASVSESHASKLPIMRHTIAGKLHAPGSVSESHASKAYKSLYRRYLGQPTRQVFAFFWFDKNNGETWETPFERLAKMAKPENWQFLHAEYQRPGRTLPILEDFLNNTFLRLQEQEKIRYSTDDHHACFNTGLQTLDEKDIFAVFRRELGTGDRCDWQFQSFYDSYARDLSPFRPLPDVATYTEDSSDLFFDFSYEIDINIAHILDDPENQERLPAKLRGERNLALSAIEGATKFLKQKVLRNYGTAIPFWYIPEKKIQLLLPLCLMRPDVADVALVADKDKLGRLYRIRTALRMDMAYINARLLRRPEMDWLNP